MQFFNFYQVFPFKFCKTFINSSFSGHHQGFAFAVTYCLEKEEVGQKKVLRGSSFDNYFSIVLLNSSITINLWKKQTLKSWSWSNNKLSFLPSESLCKIHQNAGFFWYLFFRTSRESYLYFPVSGRIIVEKILIKGSPCFGIFYLVSVWM